MFDFLNDEDFRFLHRKTGSVLPLNTSELEAYKEEARQKPKHAFAWPERKMFPVFDEKTAIYASLYAEYQDIPKNVKNKIASVLDLFDIEIDFESAKTAGLEDDEYLFPATRKIPVYNAQSVKTAEEALHASQNGMDVLTRTYAFRRLEEKAAEHNVSLTPASQKLAAKTSCHVPTLIHHLHERAQKTAGTPFSEPYRVVARGLSHLGEVWLHNTDTTTKIAETLYDLDSDCRMSYLQQSALGVPDPIQAVFNSEAVGADFVKIASMDIPMAQLAALSPQDVANIMGPDVLEDAVDANGQIDPIELQQVFSILPQDMQAQILQRLGING